MTDLLTILNFVLPCWLVNIALNSLYILKKYFPQLESRDIPIDGNILFLDKRPLLGKSTTWLAIVIAITMVPATLPWTQSIKLSFLYSLGVYFGHALGSFIKRRFKYTDGEFFPIIDHADSVLTTGSILAILNFFSWRTILLATCLTLILQPIWNTFCHTLGLRKLPL